MDISSNKILIFFSLFLSITIIVKGQETKVGFYSQTCPNVESIIRTTVEKHIKANYTLAPALLRLAFHDCFVLGCDASLLLDGPNSEKSAAGNTGLGALDVIDDAKSQLEAVCPNTVSCADIIALASRDAVNLANGPSWPVPTGRLDGKISLASHTDGMPSFRDSMDIQKLKFAEKGLDTKDLVTLVAGGHTIGTAACIVFSYRIYNITSSENEAGPEMDPMLASQLRGICPSPVYSGPFVQDPRRVQLDVGSVNKFDTSFFQNLKNRRGILESDQRLWADASTRTYVEKYSSVGGSDGLNFYNEFAKTMVKLTNIGLKGKSNGEIRKVCSKIN